MDGRFVSRVRFAVIDWFIPARARGGDADLFHRARLVVAFCWTLISLAIIYSAVLFSMNSAIGGAAPGIGVGVGVCILWVMRRTGSCFAAGNLLAAGFFAVLTAMTCRLGGLGAPSLSWYAAVPVVALSTVGRRSATFWLAATLASLVAFRALDCCGYSLPNDLTPHYIKLLDLLALIGLIVLMLELTRLYETAKKQTLAELKTTVDCLLQEKDFSNSAIASLPGIFYLFDNEGRLLRWNENFERVSGYSPKELATMRPLDFFRGQDRESIGQSVEDVFAQGQTSQEACLVSKHGTAIPHVFSGKRIMIGGRPHLVGMGFDITDRKRAEEALRESENRYRALVDNTVLGIAVMDTNYRIIMVNPTFAKLFKKSAGDFVGKNCFKEFEKRDRVCAHCPGMRAMASGKTEEVETQGVRDDGSRFYVHNRAAPFFGPDGELNGFIEMVEDIDARKRQGEALRRSEDRYRASIELTHQLAWTTDGEGMVREDIPHWRTYTGQSLEEVKGDSWAKALHPDDVERAVQVWKRAVEAKTAYETEYRLRRFDGVYRHFLTRGVPILNEHGNIREWVGVCIDITDRKLAEQDLIQASRDAEAASRAKSEFLANMSHEIRTPMTAILGFSEVLLASVTDQDQLEAVATIKRNGEYLLNLINDILDLSKIEARKLDVERIQCSPCQVLSEVVSLMRVRTAAKSLSLEIEYKRPIPESIRSDSTRLRQILINLIGNAIKFTEVGGVRLVACLLDADSDEPKMQFEVIDSGIGMTDEQIARLFKPFSQLDTSTTRKYGGTGLGLTISKRLAEELGGSVTVTSTPRRGSTFTVTVTTGPLDGVKLLDNPTEAQVSTAPENKPDKFNTRLGCRVLLAEDGPDNQRLIASLLKRAGAEVALAENGQIAYAMAHAAQDEGTPFDVILMDMQMPVMDGYDATGKLREAGYAGPIIALTAHAMNTDRDKCLHAGCDDYLAKPICHKKLISMVAKYASQQELHKGNDAPVA